MAGELVLDISEISVEGATPAEAARLRAMIERAVAQVARQLAGSDNGPGDARLGDLRLDLGEARNLLAPEAEEELTRRLAQAIRAAWERAK